MAINFNANEVEALNDIWNWCNRQWSGLFKLGTFAREVATEFASYLPLAGGTMTGDIDMDGGQIQNLIDATATGEAATYDQVRAATVYGEDLAISLADMQALGAGVKTISVDVTLPANAYLCGTVCTFVNIDNVGDTAVVSAKCGGTDDDGILAITDASTGGAAAFTNRAANDTAVRGVQSTPYMSFSNQTVALSVTSDVDLNTMTKGSISVRLFYTFPSMSI